MYLKKNFGGVVPLPLESHLECTYIISISWIYIERGENWVSYMYKYIWSDIFS